MLLAINFYLTFIMLTKIRLFLERNTFNKGVNEVSAVISLRSNKCNYLL